MELGQSLYGVVLLVTTLEGGFASFGSGVVVDDQGTVLTNLHVLDKAQAVHALTYDPDKSSYAAVDGGLPRLVFEREKDLIPVRVVRGDPLLDLAVVRLEKPARVLPLQLAPRDVAIGETVVALGHPEQNFWSATRGQVSALHQGLIQHDASINKGNSGGPLLDEKMNVVGINTLLLKGTQGISYARPIALASKLLDTLRGPIVLDRSTPQKAMESCNRARELGDPSYSQCVNWGTHYAAFRDTLNDLMAARGLFSAGLVRALHDSALNGAPEKMDIVRTGPKSRAREILRDWLERGDGRAERWVQEYGRFAMAFVLTDDPREIGLAADRFVAYAMNASRGGKAPSRPPTPAKTRAMKKDELRFAAEQDIAETPKELSAYWRRIGLKVMPGDVDGLRRTMKMGLRVDKVATVGKSEDRAWVALSGRNFDGSPYRYSTQMIRAPDGWRETYPIGTELEDYPIPKDFPTMFFPSALSAGIVFVSALGPLAIFVYSDQPDGVSVDFDYEHTWPAYLDLLRDPKRSKEANDAIERFLAPQ